jgi:similar to stage IV sporulation protein
MKNLLAYLRGYLIIMVKGEHPERFINLAYTRGIQLWDLAWVGSDTMLAKVDISSFRPLRHIARMANCRLRIHRKKGLPFFLYRLRRRRMLLVGAVLFCLILYFFSSLIWTVEVSGTKKIPAARVKTLAAEVGLCPGNFCFQVQRQDVVDHLMKEIPDLSYVEVDVGPRSWVRITEKVLPAPSVGICHIVAAKDGMIESILTLSGQPLVKEGDTVKKGQVLISGEILPQAPEQEPSNPEPAAPEAPSRFVEAQGIVHARVWYRFYGEAPKHEIREQVTGRKARIYCLRIDKKEIIIAGPRQIPYDFYRLQKYESKFPQWRDLSLPVEFVTIEVEEVKSLPVRYSFEEAVQLAAEHARSKAAKDIPPEAKLVRRQYRVLGSGDDDPVKVVLTVETRESIGVVRKFRPQPKKLDRG